MRIADYRLLFYVYYSIFNISVFLFYRVKEKDKFVMFAIIHINLHTDRIAHFINKSTFSRWCNGGSPSFVVLSKINEILNLHLTLEYVAKFSRIALQLSNTNEPAKINEILKLSYIEEDDKKLLADYHKNRIWRNLRHDCMSKNNNNLFDMLESAEV